MAFIRSGSKSEQNNGIVAIAIDRDKSSQFAVKWAAQNLLNKSSECVLIHVRCQSLHPQDIEAVPKEGRPPTEQELQLFFLPYRGFCARKGIQAKEVVLHDIDVPSALIDYISNNSVGTIVVGASNRNVLTRKFRNPDVPSSLLKSAPDSCAVYVISKGKVYTSRTASQPQTPSQATPTKQIQQEFASILSNDVPKAEDSSRTTSSQGSWKSEGSDRISIDRGSDIMQMMPGGNSLFSDRTSKTPSMDSHSSELFNRSFPSESSDFSEPLSFRSTDVSFENLEYSIASGSSVSSSSQTPKALDSEMRRLRLELKKSMEMYNSVCKEAVMAKQKASELEHLKTEKARRMEEAKLAEEAAWAVAEVEKQKAKAAVEAAQMAQRLAEMEAQKRKNAEMRAKLEAEERKRAMEAFAAHSGRYRKYTIEEIEVGTNYFANSRKIGEGGYGPVYRGVINHIEVAVKILRPDLSQGQKQFRQEVEVLSCIRHPHMVILLGACPEYGCLVYEYMDNGSLEDRLFRKNNTPSIPWKIRFKIAAEIATALLYLHHTKPEPLVHRDLKPANILLDRHYVSKIGDVGLARLVPPSVADSVTQYHMTAAAGTFCYIDPEYQQTGMLGVKSDLYSLGIMLLQIITAKSPMGLSHQVEEAIEKGTFAEMLDPMVPDWPVEEALSFAKVALQCCELRKRDRPDLATVVLPELNRLRELGSEGEGNNKILWAAPPRPYKSVPQLNARHASQEGMRNNPNVEMEIQRRSM
ncbi:U-box domain-containing protein 52-like isoform X2 [Tripterygium wilfordii]|uniref:U-box domain-containing protein 52-like isoform X2 n=1 Tax=Tripterygium wilfordii TaxID=458696 RepID=UPI0018F81157|nr:U-box domain-containing protein 52-like isoform X2 [Tripterygium wilfordii]